MLMLLPISVIITTKNEENNITRCLAALKAFDEIIVVDSNSTDNTVDMAQAYGVRVESFTWNGQYPKKRQWCLDNLRIKHDWVFFVDADEVVTDDLILELKHLEYSAAGYFVRGQYVCEGKTLKHGVMNNKLCLINRHKMEFPIVDDLDIAGMGEIEGHYQPVLKQAHKGAKIAQIKAPLVHYAYEDEAAWLARHVRYARWQAAVERRGALPQEDHGLRRIVKRAFKYAPFKPAFMFFHCYIIKRGILDGRAGYRFARSRARYYVMIATEAGT
jgi:glycosyltransferase involved in cell wall biosynthesis